MLKLVEEDKLLKPFAGIIEKRHQQVLAMEREFTYRTTRLSDKCNSYLYYGLHRTNHNKDVPARPSTVWCYNQDQQYAVAQINGIP